MEESFSEEKSIRLAVQQAEAGVDLLAAPKPGPLWSTVYEEQETSLMGTSTYHDHYISGEDTDAVGKEIGVVSESLRRCTTNPRFHVSIRERFLARSCKTREILPCASLGLQLHLLQDSLQHIPFASGGNHTARRELELIAQHQRQIEWDISPRLYDEWLESVVDTVKCNDPHVDTATERAWRDILDWGIMFMMLRRYERTFATEAGHRGPHKGDPSSFHDEQGNARRANPDYKTQ